ncbi:MAG: acyl-CoA desaturase [Pelatocladus maniniholoensis HA4357-MV3]|jgi:stearoyl-CoA desaturase (delta-9 desaturase)|uniref:Acyl-CoA desaturase n=1 Tax=Pelatocladus maniniholoensis HA4357-MV3 TaxID=1117104 RepID=A0A9E3HDC7_9NOST|nr:acyl-CoA desaturase [Pelatocladus maniniholoensis HA4357-MV3]
MQPNDIATEEFLVDSPKRQKITIKSDRLKIPQKLHALAIILVPLLGSIVAVAMVPYLSVGLVEIGLLSSMYVLTVIGITVGFHRYFAHSAFQTNTTVRVILAILGSMACQGPLIYWVSNHRRHHQYSDQPGDPHSPYFNGDKTLGKISGLWHSYVGWTFTHELTNTFFFAKDLLHDPVILKINRLYYFWFFLSYALPTILGGMIKGTSIGFISGFIWGGCVRLFLSYVFGLSINSITHLYGNRSFDTREQSTNNSWLAIPTLGEAWHNNHHAFPNSAKFGLSWWQLDPGYWVVNALEKLGLVYFVKAPTVGMIESKRVFK